MMTVEFRKDGVYIRREIDDILFGKRVIEDKISYDDLSKLNGLELIIKTPIEPVVKNGILKAIRMRVTSYRKIEKKSSSRSIETEDLPKYIFDYQRLIETKGTLPNTIREIVRERGSISYENLKNEIKRRGYKGTGGSLSATIRVLKLRDEIEVVGRGRNKIVRWIGD